MGRKLSQSRSWRVFGPGVLLVAIVTAGCARQEEAKGDPPPPEVVVRYPEILPIEESEEFTGWTRAEKTVELRARVTGYLNEVLFKEGDDVKEGTPLFKIDPRTYQADADKAEAAVRQSEAALERLQGDYRRVRSMLSSRAISVEESERIASNRLEADAGLRAARAAHEQAKLNLAFTTVIAPFSGRISRKYCDPGNLVKADDTILTTIVSLDPIHAYFEVDERTVLRLRRLIREGKVTSAREKRIPVKIGLADEEGFSREGFIDFVDNQLDHGTGTLRLRAVVPNPDTLLSPGMFVRVRVPVGPRQPATLVREEALGSDQGERFVYVVTAENKVVSRKVIVGQLEGDRRVIKGDPKSGKPPVAPGERVIVAGMQRVRPGSVVKPTLQTTQSHAQAAEAAAPRPGS